MTGYSFQSVSVAPWIEDFLASLDAILERKRASDEAVASMAGISVAQLSADTTTPDPQCGHEVEF